MHTLESCVNQLKEFHSSGQQLTPAPVDDIVDAYLVGFGAETQEKRIELAQAFFDQTEPSERRHQIYLRVLGRIVP